MFATNDMFSTDMLIVYALAATTVITSAVLVEDSARDFEETILDDMRVLYRSPPDENASALSRYLFDYKKWAATSRLKLRLRWIFYPLSFV